MESLLIRLVIALLGLIVSARIHITATIGGIPVSIPVLGIVAVVVTLALAAAVLWLIRAIIRDGGLRLRIRTAP
jgi:hypothetical protein